MNKLTLVFDFDGTIADTLLLAGDIYDKLSSEFGLPEIGEKDLQKLRGMSPGDIVKRFEIPWWKIPRLLVRGKAELSVRIDSLAPVEGIGPALKQLKKSGQRLFIVSSNSAENIEKFLAKNGLSGLFDFIDADSSLWGKAEILRKLIRKENLAPGRAVYIGDEIRDIEAAKKAGVRIIAVTWGFNTKAALQKFKPDYLVERPDDLIKVTGEL
ncbi:MAG: HAD-IA family hydrolase [Parcubacteria group bacterium]|jgi:phosphoglycolate phosphatase-like HAD superfamily hydrolase